MKEPRIKRELQAILRLFARAIVEVRWQCPVCAHVSKSRRGPRPVCRSCLSKTGKTTPMLAEFGVLVIASKPPKRRKKKKKPINPVRRGENEHV